MAARTPLYERHVGAGARMVEFGGFDMPLQYTTIRDEHIAVRTRCGLFDLSHMGEVRFIGDDALDVVQNLISQCHDGLEVGGALQPCRVLASSRVPKRNRAGRPARHDVVRELVRT